MSWSLGPPIFGKEQIPVLLKKRKSASEFFGIVSSDAGRAWRKPSVYVIFQDEGALCEAPAPGCTGDGVSSRRKAKRFPAIRSGPGRGDVQNGKRQGNSGGSVKKLRFQQSFSRHGIARASAALLIWLNENVPLYASLNSAAVGNLRGNSRNSGVLCFLRAAWFGSSLSKWRDFFQGFYSHFIEKAAPLPIKHEKYRFLIQKNSEMRK